MSSSVSSAVPSARPADGAHHNLVEIAVARGMGREEGWNTLALALRQPQAASPKTTARHLLVPEARVDANENTPLARDINAVLFEDGSATDLQHRTGRVEALGNAAGWIKLGGQAYSETLRQASRQATWQLNTELQKYRGRLQERQHLQALLPASTLPPVSPLIPETKKDHQELVRYGEMLENGMVQNTQACQGYNLIAKVLLQPELTELAIAADALETPDIRRWRDKLRQAVARGDKIAQGEAHNKLGYLRADNPVEHFCAALRIGREIGSMEVQANAHYMLGYNRVDPVENYRAELRIGREIGNKFFQGDAYNGLGRNGIDPVENHIAALRIGRETGDKIIQDEAYSGLRCNGIDLSNHLEALRIGREIGDKKMQGEAHIGLGRNGIDAVENCHAALRLGQEIGNKRMQGDAHIELGRNGVDALNNYRAALQLGQESGDKTVQGHALNGLGSNSVDPSENHRMALRLGQESGDQAIQGHALNGLARIGIDQVENHGAALRIGWLIGNKDIQNEAKAGLPALILLQMKVQHAASFFTSGA